MYFFWAFCFSISKVSYCFFSCLLTSPLCCSITAGTVLLKNTFVSCSRAITLSVWGGTRSSSMWLNMAFNSLWMFSVKISICFLYSSLILVMLSSASVTSVFNLASQSPIEFQTSSWSIYKNMKNVSTCVSSNYQSVLKLSISSFGPYF